MLRRSMLIRVATVLPSALILGLLSLDAPNGARAHATLGSLVPAGKGDGVAYEWPRLLHGRVLLPDDGSPLGLRAYLTTPTYSDSVDVDAAGGFAFALRRVDCDSLDIRLDASDESTRRYHPARLRVAVPSAGDGADSRMIRALLVPTTFTIAGGSFAGVSVPIIIDAALAGPGERSRYWRVSRSGPARGTPIGWPDERFPLPVAVIGRFSAMRPADSASFWAIARELEHDLGRTLFRPISIDSARSEGWSVTLSLDPDEDTPGITFITYDGHGDLFDATIAIRSSPILSDRRVVMHELLHALGFGHAVGWHSVMNTSYQSAARPTASDVAYAQLFYRLRRLHVEQRATHGILESGGGGRRPLPTAVLSRACSISALASRRAR